MHWPNISKYWLLSPVMVACTTFSASANTCSGRIPHWTISKTVPTGTQLNPQNLIEIYADGRLEWNGTEVSEDQVREYLTLIPRMSSANVTVLKANPAVNCAVIQRLRKTMDETLTCSAAKCVEVDG